MTDHPQDGQSLSPDQYRTLLAVSQAIVSHRDLPAQFHELASQLRPVVHFDYLVLRLHDPASDTTLLHVLETAESALGARFASYPVADTPLGVVLQTQQPLVVPHGAGLTCWPDFLDRVKSIGVNSGCFLPLTTARRRLGVQAFARSIWR